MRWAFLLDEELSNEPMSSKTAKNGMARLESLPPAPMNGKPINGMSANGRPMNGKPVNGKPVNGVPVNGKPINGKPVNGAPVNGKSINGTPMNGMATSHQLAGRHSQFENETRPALTPEQFKLRNMLLLAREQKGVRSVLVTGTGEGVGVTSVAADLALGLCWDRQQEVLMIEANLHRPRLREFFRLSSESCGWILEDGADYLDVTVAGMPNLVVIPAGSSTAATTLDVRHLTETLRTLHETYDFVIIDAPPVKLHPELLILGAHLDGVILVAEAERTRMQVLEETIDALNHAKANLLGVALNREKTRLPVAIEKWL